MKPKACSNPLIGNPWKGYGQSTASTAAASSDHRVGVMDFSATGEAIDARKTVLESKGIHEGCKVLHRSSGAAFVVSKLAADGKVTVAPATGARQQIVGYDDFRNNYEMAVSHNIVVRSSSEVDFASDDTVRHEYYRSWSFVAAYEYYESISIPELKVQLEPRKAVFATSKLAKDKVHLPLVSGRFLFYLQKGDYTFPHYAKVDVSDYRDGDGTFAFTPPSLRPTAKFAPSWVVQPTNEKEEANCIVKMFSIDAYEGIKVPVIVNTKAIEKDAELKVYKKKVDKAKPDKPEPKRLSDSFTAAGPAKKMKK